MGKRARLVVAAVLYIFTFVALLVVVYAPSDDSQQVGFRAFTVVFVSVLTIIVLGVPAVVAGYRYGARRAFRDAMACDSDERLRPATRDPLAR